MLRDIGDAFRDIARIQRERQADNSDTSLSDRIHGSPSSTDCAGQHGSQLKSLKPEHCAQIGQVLKPFWYTTQHAQENLGQFKKEIRKWERTIAFVDEGDVPDDSDSAMIENMLVLCSVMLQVENMATIRVALMKLFEPLAKHTASLVSTSEEHEALRYAIAQSLLCLTKAMIDSGLAKLSVPQKEYVRQCESAARAFIMAVDNRPHLTEEDLADVNGDDCPLKTFEDLLKRRVSEELLHDQNS